MNDTIVVFSILFFVSHEFCVIFFLLKMSFDFLTEHLTLLPYANYPGTMYLQRFKEMKEMHGGSSRDDRQKREQLRQEREMAKFAQMYPLIYSCTNYYSL